MFTYILGAASVVVMCSAALVYLLIKYNMINVNALVTIGASTITGSLFLPVIKAVFIRLSSFVSVFIGIAVSFMLFLILVFCISYTISALILDKGIKRFLCNMKAMSVERGFLWFYNRKRNEEQVGAFKQVKFGIANVGNMNFIAGVRMPFELKSSAEVIEEKEECGSPEFQEAALCDEVVEEEPASEGEDQSVSSLEQCIDKAFDCKENGDMEDALLYYMVALDYKPQRELAAWLVVEICSLYKDLGQTDKIREFLDEILNTEMGTVEMKTLSRLRKVYG